MKHKFTCLRLLVEDRKELKRLASNEEVSMWMMVRKLIEFWKNKG